MSRHEGYLALTLGTTITLDTDAAGYGWFVDQTPFVNEEFTLSAVSPLRALGRCEYVISSGSPRNPSPRLLSFSPLGRLPAEL